VLESGGRYEICKEVFILKIKNCFLLTLIVLIIFRQVCQEAKDEIKIPWAEVQLWLLYVCMFVFIQDQLLFHLDA
jgi:hypothetical protein